MFLKIIQSEFAGHQNRTKELQEVSKEGSKQKREKEETKKGGTDR